LTGSLEIEVIFDLLTTLSLSCRGTSNKLTVTEENCESEEELRPWQANTSTDLILMPRTKNLVAL
jgi:hypothetical protein